MSVNISVKKTLLALIAACTILRLAVAQEIGANAGTEAKIRALEMSWAQAEARKDNKALNALFDDALLFVEYDGQLFTKAEYLTRVRDSRALGGTTESLSIRVLGDTALAIGVYREEVLRNGRPYLRRRRFIDTWVYKKGTWVCVAAAATLLAR
jgi:ketosteroid isomerase-like protein